jgi:hypothetical protein
MPIVKNMLEKHLGKPILVGKDFDPEEAAVVGAAKTAYYIRHAGTWVPTHYEFAPLNLGKSITVADG